MFSDFKNYNKNIQLAMLSSLFIASGNGLLMGTIFSVFVKAVGGSNESLGFASTFGGVVLVFALVPSGYLADKFNRKIVIRTGLVFLLLGFIGFLESNNIIDIFLSFGIINIGNGMLRPGREAMIADSVITNQREKVYGQLYFIQQAANGVGPLLAVFMFYVIGDNWNIETLKQVIFIGVLILIIGIIIMFFMQDKYSYGDESESTNRNGNGSKNGNSNNNHKETNWSIPILVVALSIVIGLGAGMTVRFFPIFFKEIYNLPPTTTNFIYFLVALMTGIMSLVTSKYAKIIGKVESIIFVQLVAILSLLIIAMIPPLVILIPIFLIRGSFMNGSQPVKDAIVMDLVPKRQRGRFQSIQVLSQSFFWSLSAGLGGILLDYYNYSVLYVVTALIYIFGTLPFLFIRKKVSK